MREYRKVQEGACSGGRKDALPRDDMRTRLLLLEGVGIGRLDRGDCEWAVIWMVHESLPGLTSENGTGTGTETERLESGKCV